MNIYRGPCVGIYNNPFNLVLLVHTRTWISLFCCCLFNRFARFLIRLSNCMYTEKLTELACISYLIHIVHVSQLKVRAHTTSFSLVKHVNRSKSIHPFLANVAVLEPNCAVPKIEPCRARSKLYVPKAYQTEPCN